MCEMLVDDIKYSLVWQGVFPWFSVSLTLRIGLVHQLGISPRLNPVRYS